jgi:hypothetical protein
MAVKPKKAKPVRRKPSKEAQRRRAAIARLDDKRDLAVFLLPQIVSEGHPNPAGYAWQIADAFEEEQEKRHPDARPPAPASPPEPDRLAVN